MLRFAEAEIDASKTNALHFSLLFSRHNDRISTPTVTHHSQHHSTPFRTSPIALRAGSRYFPSNPMDRQFPPEVVLLIVEASLDPYDSFDMLDDHIPRYSTLCNYSRLNSVWRNISKPLLYESVVLMTDRAERELLFLLEKKGSTEAGMIKSLSIRGFGGSVTDAVVDILRDQVESLLLDEAEFALVRGGQDLRRLLLHEITVRDHPESRWTPNVAYPQLHYLQIATPAYYDAIPLPAHHFPQLRSFYSCYFSQQPFVPTPSILSRLTALHVDDPYEHETLIPDVDQLKLLSISGDYDDDTEIFPLFDKPTRFIHLYRHELRAGMDALEYQVNNEQAGLETIFWDYSLPDDRDVEDEWEEYQCQDLIHRSTDVLVKRGVKIVRGSIEFRKAVERMEVILAKEKRAVEDKERKAGKW